MRRTLDKSQMLMSEAFLPTAKLIEFLKEETLIYQENKKIGEQVFFLRWYEDYMFVPDARRIIFACQ